MGRLAVSDIKAYYKSTVIKNRLQPWVVAQAFNPGTWEKGVLSLHYIIIIITNLRSSWATLQDLVVLKPNQTETKQHNNKKKYSSETEPCM